MILPKLLDDLCLWQVCKVCKYASIQVCNYAIMYIFKYASASSHVCKCESNQLHASMWVSKYESLQMCKYANMLVYSKHASVKPSGISETRFWSSRPRLKMSESQWQDRDRNWKCPSLNDETKTETEKMWVSMARPRLRLKVSESQWRDRDRDWKI